MKFTMDEVMKHRLIGLSVILALLAIILPAMLKKNSQRLEEQQIAIHFPPQPQHSVTDTVDEEQVFHSVKVAHVRLPSLAEEKNKHQTEYDQALSQSRPEPLLRAPQPADVTERTENDKDSVPVADVRKVKIAVVETNKIPKPVRSLVKHSGLTAKKVPSPPSEPVQSVTVLPSLPKNPPAKAVATKAMAHHYAVQLGVFRDENNALALLKALQAKGFSGQKSRIGRDAGTKYKVTVGDNTTKEQAEDLKRILFSQMNIKGFIIEKGVS
ncbi:MAG: SPOR domain-containing protein [Legionellaceae bacterium]|nr:SPOR domain-containing protein [Legionellaceae bacterium]